MEHRLNTEIVCYAGGTCGDLIAALIDPRRAVITKGAVVHIAERTRLKKPHLFTCDLDKDQYLESVDWGSISSHDTEYHIQRCHRFISVIIQSDATALWAADRFRRLHRPQVWEEMSKACGADSIDKYAEILMHHTNLVAKHTENVVTLESILHGCVTETLEATIGRSITIEAKKFYHEWLQSQQHQ